VAIWHDGLKGIWNVQTGSLELYDIRSDPGELVDISSSRSDLANALQRDAEGWLETCRSNKFETGEGMNINEEDMERLRSMGYLN